MDDPLVVPDGVSFDPEKLAELAELLQACWVAVVAKQPSLEDPQIGFSITEPDGVANHRRRGGWRRWCKNCGGGRWTASLVKLFKLNCPQEADHRSPHNFVPKSPAGGELGPFRALIPLVVVLAPCHY